MKINKMTNMELSSSLLDISNVIRFMALYRNDLIEQTTLSSTYITLASDVIYDIALLLFDECDKREKESQQQIYKKSVK